MSPLRPAGNEISPSPVGGECGSRRIPSSPALEGLAGHRPWELTPLLLGPVRETFFFLLAIPCVSVSLSAFHVAPHARVHATTCHDQRPGGAPVLGLPNRHSGCPFLFHTTSARCSWFCGHIIPATGWHSAYCCQRPSSWSDVWDFVDHNSVQPQFFKIGSCRFSVPVLFSAFRLWRVRPVSCSQITPSRIIQDDIQTVPGCKTRRDHTRRYARILPAYPSIGINFPGITPSK